VPLSSARQNKESEKGLLNTNKQNKYKDICKSEIYANKNKELNNY
jgi:ssDNA-specific exonuclease RecJ